MFKLWESNYHAPQENIFLAKKQSYLKAFYIHISEESQKVYRQISATHFKYINKSHNIKKKSLKTYNSFYKCIIHYVLCKPIMNYT